MDAGAIFVRRFSFHTTQIRYSSEMMHALPRGALGYVMRFGQQLDRFANKEHLACFIRAVVSGPSH